MKRNVLLAGVLAIVLVAGLAATAVAADIVTYSDTKPLATDKAATSGTVNVSASVSPKITLTITTPDAGQSVAFGVVEPGTAYTKNVGLSVDSNKDFDLVVGAPSDITWGLSNLNGTFPGVKGQGSAFTDTISLTAPWDIDPADYTATVLYTVTQK